MSLNLEFSFAKQFLSSVLIFSIWNINLLVQIIAGEQIRNTPYWEAVFSMQSLRQQHDATVEELLEEVFSLQSVPRLCNRKQM